jgi:hypothetical protein
LLNNLDRDVVALLRSRRDISRDFLDQYEQVLLDLARAELPGITVDRNHFFHQGRRYDLRWELAEQNDSEFFRLQASELKLAWDLVRKAKARKPDDAPLPPVELTLHYGRMEGQWSSLARYLEQSGTLQVDKLSFRYADTTEEHLVVGARTDGGQILQDEDPERLLRIPGSAAPLPEFEDDLLQEVMQGLHDARHAETAEKLEEFFEQENAKLERWADDRREALQLAIDEMDREIKALKRENRQLSSLQEKLEAKRRIKRLERERDEAMLEYHETKKAIEQEEDQLLDGIEAKLQVETRVETLFSVRWRLVH